MSVSTPPSGNHLDAVLDFHRPSVLFLGIAYAGWSTRFMNLEQHTKDDRRIRPVYRRISGWDPDGFVERLPLAPGSVKGRIRGVIETAPFAAWPRPDVIWTSAVETALPYLWAQVGPLRRPMILDTDATVEQLEAFAEHYYSRPPKRGLPLRLSSLIERAVWGATAMFTPWSHWAAEALREHGVPDDRIVVLPPGVDLEQWTPGPRRQAQGLDGDRLRLLFVGGDFVRKGGDLLLDLFRNGLAEGCELDIVTRDTVGALPDGVRLHRAESNSPLLKDLYARADLFVLPTRAECFGIASVEALASGLPVIMGNVGGASDIVSEGETGWLIAPDEHSLARVLRHAIEHRSALAAMGRNARATAEAKFDGRRNDRRVVDIALDLARAARS